MTFKKRLLMILVLALAAGGLYGAGRLGMAVLPREEEETEEDFLFMTKLVFACKRLWW